jgi:hypothetical protein
MLKLRVSSLLVIVAGSGCAMRLAQTVSSRPMVQVPAVSSTSQLCGPATHSVAEGAGLDMIPVEGGGMGHDLVGYDSVIFGPIGERILAERRPQDMALLKRTLEYTDERRPVVIEAVGGILPTRKCDYALLIGEKLLQQDGKLGHYSFGPNHAYEYRDAARCEVLKALFGADAVLPEMVEYVYLDTNGKDISKEERRMVPGTP